MRMTEKKTLNDIWKDDLLNRRGEAEDIIRFLVHRTRERTSAGKSGSYVLNLDAEWGYGKTFFLTHLKQHLELEGHPVVYVNAWEDDYAEDAFISIVSSIRSAMGKKEYKIPKKFTQGLVKAAPTFALNFAGSLVIGAILQKLGATPEVVKNAAATAASAAGEKVKDAVDDVSDQLIGQFEENKKSVEGFKKSLSDLMKELEVKKHKMPMFILIDELDRCRPLYAIALLERVKHLFDVDGVVFIVATNTNQLQHSIKAVYGHDFDAKQYLARFFDRRYELAPTSREALVKTLFETSGIKLYVDLGILASPLDDDHVTFFTGVADMFGLSLRDIDQCFDVLHSVVSLWQRKEKIQLFYLLPLIFAYHKNNEEGLFEMFSNTKKSLINDWVTEHMGRSAKQISFYPNLIEVYLTYVANHSVNEMLNQLSALTQKSHSPQVNWLLKQAVECDRYRIQQGETLVLIKSYPEMVKNACRWNRVDASASRAAEITGQEA